MASKRLATSELNDRNWNTEEEPEDAGAFERAGDDVIKNRIIKRAVRRNPIGSSLSANESQNDGGKKNIFGNFTGFSSKPSSPAIQFNFGSNAPQPPKMNGIGSTTEEKDVADNDYLARLKGLNESVTKWIKTHVDENPFVNLTPIFNDYEKYLKEVLSKRTENTKSAEMGNKEVFKSYSFKPPEKTSVDTPTTVTASKSDFGKIPESPKFNFGIAAASPSKPFTFGSAPSGFAFQSDQPFTFTNVDKPVDEEPAKNDEEDEEPPKEKFTPVMEEDHIYTIRCKVFFKKDGTFSDRGVGNLFLKKVPNSGKTQLIVRAESNLGNIVCNFILSESIPMQRMGNKDVMLVCAPIADNKSPPTSILFRVKSPEEADQLLKQLEQHKK